METRRLGRSDLKVPRIMLGTMTWGQQNTEDEAFAQLDLAFEHGVNWLDSAELYPIPPKAETQGRTETMIGNWLAARRNRDRVLIATKSVGRTRLDWFRPGGAPVRLDRRNLSIALDQSLARLRTDYVDLYQLHWPDRPMALFGSRGTTYQPQENLADEVPIEETLSALGDLVNQGKIRHVGLSNESAWGTMRFLQAADRGEGPRVVSIQNAYNLVNRTFEIGLAEISVREDVGLLAYSPLAQGYLTGKYQNGARPPGARTTLFDRGQRYETPGTAPAIDAYLALARDFGLDPAQLALAFVTSRPFVTSTIIGATSIAQLETALASTSIVIKAELAERIDAIHHLHSNPAP